MGKRKCTYDGCYQHFDTLKDMIRHKTKDPDHSYCKKCDVDCRDDVNYLIHQIESPKHICCPACGMEFKSSSGRDRHVEISHPADQNIKCQGCKRKFSRASAMIYHVEHDECPVIKLEDFHRERAERSVQKNAWTEVLDSRQGSSAATAPMAGGSMNDEDNGGVSLLEHNGTGLELDWQGRPRAASSQFENPLVPSRSGPYRAPQPLVSGNTITSLNKFAALPSAAPKAQPHIVDANGDLIDLESAQNGVTKLDIGSGVWAADRARPTSQHLFPNAEPTLQEEDTGDYGGLSEISFKTYGTGSRVPSMLEKVGQDAQSRVSVPSSAPMHNRDPNASLSRVSTQQRLIKSGGTLKTGDLWDSIREMYVCPGSTCGRMFKDHDAFYDHLLSPAHVGGHQTCPSCLNRFNSVSAWVNHAESGSKGCQVRKSYNYNQVMREMTAGLLGAGGHLEDGTVKYVAPGDEGWEATPQRW